MMKFWMISLVAVGLVGTTVSVAQAQESAAPAAAGEEGAAKAAPAPESLNKGIVALAAGLAIAIAAFGGAFAQGRAATAALEGIARNPGARKDLFVPFILALALIESLVIYALIIAFQLAGKVG